MRGSKDEHRVYQRTQALLDIQRRVLEQIAGCQPLNDVLGTLVRGIESHHPEMLGSILLLGENGCLHHGAAPSLPVDYNRYVENLPIGPCSGSCGTAAHRRE